MRAESLQRPVAKYELTFIDKDNVLIEFFENIQEKTNIKGDTSPTTTYEYDHYMVTVRNRPNLIDQLNKNYNEWLQYAIEKDNREHIPTELELLQKEYSEWESMDTVSTVEEMKQQDPAMADEYVNMMIEMRGMIYTLSASEQQPVGFAAIHIPQPSEKLKEFKNKFNKI